VRTRPRSPTARREARLWLVAPCPAHRARAEGAPRSLAVAHRSTRSPRDGTPRRPAETLRGPRWIPRGATDPRLRCQWFSPRAATQDRSAGRAEDRLGAWRAHRAE